MDPAIRFGRDGLLEGWRGLERSFGAAVREGDWRWLVRFPVQGPVDLFLYVAAHAIRFVQRLLRIQAPARPLTPEERGIAGAVGLDRLDLAAVRIVEGPCGLLGLPGRAFVVGNTIFFPSRWLRRERDREATLVHELVHVWQFQSRGIRYLSEALWAQWLGEGYDYRRGVDRGRSWARLNPEQQAQLVEDAWRRKQWDRPPSSPDRLAGVVREARRDLA